jgi:phenylalanyl-tRNA synthetase beta chain
MLLENSSDKVKIKPIPKYPATSRDLAIMVDADQNAGPIMSTIKKMGGNLLESVDIFDIYQGEQIEKGKKSVAFSLVFRSLDRTLVDKEVNNKFNGIVKQLEKVYNAKLRM